MNLPNIHDLVTHLDPRNCGLTVQLSEQASAEINIRHRERVAEREEQLSKVTAERDEARAELAAMREAVAVTTALAEWSARYPRGVIYSASNRQMDAELIELEERAKAAMTKLQPSTTPTR